MASLTGQSVASSYEQLLHVDRDGGGNATTLVDIKDGDNGTTFALQLATDKINVNGSSTFSGGLVTMNRSQADESLSLAMYSTVDGHMPALLFKKSASNTIGTATATGSGDVLGQIVFQGHDTDNDVKAGAIIRASADAAPDGDSVPTKLQFMTSDLDDSGSPTVALTIDDGQVVELNSGQLKFPASQNASADANTLDDYEEGNGTPTVTMSGSGSVTLGASPTFAYTKVGNIVSFQFEFSTTAVSSPVGTLQVALPFSSSATYYSAGSVRVHSETFDGSPFLLISPSSSVVQFQCSKTGSATTNITPTAGTRYYFGQITYRAA